MSETPDICPSCGGHFSAAHGHPWIVGGKFYCCELCARRAATNL